MLQSMGLERVGHDLATEQTVLKAWAPDVASESPGLVLEMQILGSQANPTESKTLGVEHRSLWFNKPSR